MAIGTDKFEGILLVDKPQGITSHDVVDRLRRKLQMKQIGHAGTLDPLATGLLILLIGKATKASQYLMSLDKIYEGRIRLGEVTDTHDSEGRVLETSPVPAFTERQLDEAMHHFCGDQYQTPPMFSAKKVGGVPLYKMARKGKEIEREPCFIHIFSFERTQWAFPEIHFRLHCSKGTYVRTVAHDLGRRLGCGAHLSSLRRTVTHKLTVEQSNSLDALENMPLLEIKKRLLPVCGAVPSAIL